MRPSGPPRQNPFEEYDLTSSSTETDSSRLDLYRNSIPGPNLSFIDEPEPLSFGGLSLSMRTDSLRNLNIVSQGPPLPQELRSPSQSMQPMPEPVYGEELNRPLRPQSMSNIRSPPSLMGVDPQVQMYHSSSVNSSPRVSMQQPPLQQQSHFSPGMGQSPHAMMQADSRYPAPRPTNMYERYNIQMPEDFAAYNHVFASHSRGGGLSGGGMSGVPGGGMVPPYHVTPPAPMQYSPPPYGNGTPPLSYRPTPRFVPPLVENHNLHYRPNREQQLANLAKQKAAAAAAAGGGASSGPTTMTSGGTSMSSTSTSTESSPMASGKEVTPFPAMGASAPPPNTPASSTTSASIGISSKSTSPPAVDSRKVPDKKDIVVYMVKFKISQIYCILGTASLRVALHDQVVVAVDLGEDVGVVNSILSLSYFMEQFSLTSEEETLMAMKCIVRLATEKDKNDVLNNNQEESRLVEVIADVNRKSFQFPITISDTEYQADRKKLTIFYDTLEPGAAIDIKELLKAVFSIVQTKVSCKKMPSKSSKVSGSGGTGGW